MFKNSKEFKNFMIFVNIHYELNDVYFKGSEKIVLYEGPHNSEYGDNKYSPCKLPENLKPEYKKRNTVEEVYQTWKLVMDNLQKIRK